MTFSFCSKNLSKTEISKGQEQVLKQLLLASRAHLSLESLAHRATVAVLVVTVEDKGRCRMLPPNQFVEQIIKPGDQLELCDHSVDLDGAGGKSILRLT